MSAQAEPFCGLGVVVEREGRMIVDEMEEREEGRC